MKKSLERKKEERIKLVNDIGQQKLTLYADSFRNLAKTYETKDLEYKEADTRQEYMVKRKLWENREVLAEHIYELADILTTVADENVKLMELDARQSKMLAHSLKSSRLLMENLCLSKSENDAIQIDVRLSYIGRGTFATVKAAKIFSLVLGREIIPKESTPLYIMDDFSGYSFVLKPAYFVETGVARAVKETEKQSGDSYGFCEDEKGRFAVLLSDGMGSGNKAKADSELVIGLSERFLEAGYPLKKTMKLINAALVSKVENKNMSTLDICDMNLHTGVCCFAKVGAGASYIKRENFVEKVMAGSLPLGIFADMEPEVMEYTLNEGDYVIMLSDGVLEGLGQVIGEDGLQDFLSAMNTLSAKEMANHLLNYVIRICNGKIRDDMTILVTKVIDF